VLPLLALGAFNNRVSVPRLRAELPSIVARRRFMRAVGAELVLLAVVVGVTAVLVSEAPAKNQVARTSVTTTKAMIGPFHANVGVMPAAAGTNRVELAFTDQAGNAANLAQVDLAASLPSRKLGPLRFRARRTGPGKYRVGAASFPIAGAWQIQLTVRRGEFDEWLKTIPIQIRKEATP
jgi:hypothetical protein